MTESGSADLKKRHRAMWALGDYSAVATEVIPGLGRRVVEACHIGPGQRVLDMAAGSGNAALPAAECGGNVVGGDITPELLEAGGRVAAPKGGDHQWQ
ncbi:class I SAM-dependent methyltransferase, partial [Nocardia abscessus]|uniref:class I SAM-dependent methyltransferase n=1 Tax=Nocardia abscessus TaxID=120957 RepID=UPI003CC7C54A